MLVFIFPFLLSFDKKVSFFRRWPALIPSYLVVGTAYVGWDVYATHEGHWGFNEDHLIGIHFLGLPLEEILFFFTVPYACLFTYEVIRAYTNQWKVPYRPAPYVFLSAVSWGVAFIFIDQGYTFLVMLSLALLAFVMPFFRPRLLMSSYYWIYFLVTMGLFVMVNMVLTAVPVVTYGEEAIWGGDGLFNDRFFTIPLEDIIYNITLLSFYLFVYDLFRKRWKISRRRDHEEW